MDAPRPSGSRFVKTTQQDRDEILKKVIPANTIRNTKYAVKMFKAWLRDNYNNDDFELLSDQNLNELLTIFYAEIRSEKGERLSPSTMNTIRSGISRHLESPPYKRNVSLFNNPLYASSNKMFFSVIKQIKEEGGDKTRHYPAIEERDLEKILSPEAFDIDNPKELMLKVFFDLQYNFARRGRENLGELKPSYFEFHCDDAGREYTELQINESTKNHQTVDQHIQKQRMYATGQLNCPVKSLKLYLSKLNVNAKNFYCKEITNKSFSKEDETWYTAVPKGKNTLGNFMKVISKKLGLSYSYTNHSIRATVVTVLSKHGFQSRQIMRLTGHKSESSLRSYDKENSSKQKREISETLNNFSNSKSNTLLQSTSTTMPLPLNKNKKHQTVDFDLSTETDLFEADDPDDEELLLEAVKNSTSDINSESSTTAVNNKNTTSNYSELKNISMSCLNKQFNISHMENCSFTFNINVNNK